MKVDQYRVQKHKEYSFLVPAGMDLGDLQEPEKGYLVTFSPYVLEQRDVELESIVQGPELAKSIESLQNECFAVNVRVPVSPPSTVESDDEGID